MASAGAHWDAVYTTKATDDVSWFQSEPATSLDLLSRWAPPGGSIVDVGAGTSTLVDRLADAGSFDVTLVDVSAEALDVVRRRLDDRAGRVSFEVADIRSWVPTRTFDAWHDRAVFHFLVEPDDQQAYVRLASTAVAPGGVVVLATFAADGPATCSGLPTARYDADDLARLFAPAFVLEHHHREEHVTPWGAVQPFSWVVLRRAVA
ncbi:MAG TPA: class I SAM-dependent methyltransferase [Acidimicrobiales bacterium]|nr:class I SAM-dependent methyltransferase [Acidimicrobiales bacterium]